MKKSLAVLLVCATLSGGCGHSHPSVIATSDSSGYQATATVPTEGGRVAIPGQTGISGELLFHPGAETGTQVLLKSSLEAPSRLPFVGLNSPHAMTKNYFYLTFEVTRPVPLRLLEGVRLSGTGLPVGHQHYHADLFSLNRPGLAQSDSSAVHLQEFPGEHDERVVTHDELFQDATLTPGTTYTMGFKSTEQRLLEFKVVNNSGVAPCYLVIKGENPNIEARDRRFYYVNGDGELVPMDVDDLGPDGTADYNVLVPENGIVKLPLTLSGRLYISLGAKLKTQLFKPSQPSDPPALWGSPNGWSNPADPNYNTLWEFVEFDYKISPDSGLPGMGVNTTQVQMTAIPTQLELRGPTHEPLISGALGDGTRSQLMTALANDPEFRSLIVEGTATNTSVSPLRAISADNGILNVRHNIPGVPHFDAEFYDDYIDQVWEKYKTEDLVMKTSAFGVYRGRVNEQNQMVFTQANKRSVIVPKPDSTDVIVGDGALMFDRANATTDEERAVVGEIGSAMSACFNRTTLLVLPEMVRNPQDFDPANFALFYQNAPTNLYSKLNHSLSLPTEQAPLGGAYGFGYDDNLNQSSVIIDNKAPTHMILTIPAF